MTNSRTVINDNMDPKSSSKVHAKAKLTRSQTLMPGNDCKTRNCVYKNSRNFDFTICHRMKRKHCHVSKVEWHLIRA
jgi:hypothetical protein